MSGHPNMIKRSLRRVSTHPERSDAAGPDLNPARRTSTVPSESSRRPSLATISRKLGRSKKSQVSTVTETRDDSNKLGELFISLPHDIHALIFSLLPTSDILSLRLTSATINSLLNDCSSTVTNSVLSFTVTPYDLPHVLRLYPQPHPNYDLTHLLALLRRHHAILNTTSMLVNFIQHKIYMLRTHRNQNSPDSEQIQRRLTNITTTALWHIAHLLEHHRSLLLNIHPTSHTHTNDSSPRPSRFWPCQPCISTISTIVSSYPQYLLLPTYHVHHLLVLHLRQSSRAPSYTGTIERALRGWSRKPPGDEQLAMVVLLGGLEELRKITVLKGTYNNRLETLKTFLIKVEDAVEERKARDAAEEERNRRLHPRTGKMVVGPRGIERIELVAQPDTNRNTATAYSRGNSSHDGRESTTSTPSHQAAAPAALAEQTIATDLTTTHRPLFQNLTEDTLTQIPPLEDIFLLPLRRRIESESIININHTGAIDGNEQGSPHADGTVLVPAVQPRGLLDFLPEDERDEELETPYHWVSRVVSGEEDEDVVVGFGAPRNDGEAAADAHGGVADDQAETDGHGQGEGAADGGGMAGQGQAQGQAQGQHQHPTNVNARGRMPSQGAFTFGEFRRSILVPVGRGD